MMLLVRMMMRMMRMMRMTAMKKFPQAHHDKRMAAWVTFLALAISVHGVQPRRSQNNTTTK